MNPLRGEQKGPGRCPGAVLCFNMRVASDQRVCLRVGPRLHGRNPPPPAARSKTVRRTRSFGGRVESRLLRSP